MEERCNVVIFSPIAQQPSSCINVYTCIYVSLFCCLSLCLSYCLSGYLLAFLSSCLYVLLSACMSVTYGTGQIGPLRLGVGRLGPATSGFLLPRISGF